MAPNRRARRQRWSSWWSDGNSEGESASSQSRSGNGRWPRRQTNSGAGGWAETTCGTCGKGRVYNRHIQQTPCCSKCGARFVLQPRARNGADNEDSPTSPSDAGPPGPILALYERHVAAGDGETAAVLLEQWPALGGKPTVAPGAKAEAEMAVDEEGGGATLTRKQAETAVQKAHQKLRRARIEEEKQHVEWDKAEAHLEAIRLKVGDAALEHEKALNAYHEAVARQAAVNNRSAFATPPTQGTTVGTEDLPEELYAATSPELGRAASDANAKIASLRGEIQAVIEAVRAQGRDFEAQRAAQQAAATPGEDQASLGPNPLGGDDGGQTAPKSGANGPKKVRRAGGRPEADIEACKKLSLAAKKALKENGALNSDACPAGATGDGRLSS